VKIAGSIRRLDDFGCHLADNGSRWLEARLPARAGPDAGDSSDGSPPGSEGEVDLITLYGGLSGVPPAQLQASLSNVLAALRPGGLVLLLEHDVETAHAGLDASLAVTLAFLCAGESWDASQAHPRAFRAADEWAALMRQNGLVETGRRERIERTPFGDGLLAFQKPPSP
jgi:hypothetical protein